VTSANCSLRTPYGPAACRWDLDDGTVSLEVDVPPNTTAVVVRPGLAADELSVASGSHRWSYAVPQPVVERWLDQAAVS
jgi:alpha-L-rhamnosidase